MRKSQGKQNQQVEEARFFLACDGLLPKSDEEAIEWFNCSPYRLLPAEPSTNSPPPK